MAKVGEKLKIFLELKSSNTLKGKGPCTEHNFLISGLSEEKIYLEKEIRIDDISQIDKITLFLGVDGKWKEYEIGSFFLEKKNFLDIGTKKKENKERMSKTFCFSLLDGSDKAKFKRDLSFALC
jgi:hypothetical protein